MKWPRLSKNAEESPSPAPAPEPAVVRSLEEERHETISLVEERHLSRDEKLEAERAFYDGAGEVDFAEHEFRRRRHDSLDEIRHHVDALVVTSSPPAVVAAVADVAPPPPEPAPRPEPASVEAPARRTAPLSDEERALVARHVPGTLTDGVVLYYTDAGKVVDARYRRSKGVAEERKILAIIGSEVTELPEIETMADGLRPRRALETAPPPAPAAAPASAPEAPEDPPAERTRRLKLPFGGSKSPAPAEAEAPEAPPSSAAEAPRASRLKLPFGKKREASTEALEAAPAEAAEKKRRFGLGRKKD